MSNTASLHRPAPRKLPRQARSTETVRAIVEAAARILEAEGLGGFTTNAVAERAGVSVGSLYQYYPDKDALVGALIRRETSVLVEDWQASLASATGHEALTGMIASAVAHQLRRPVLARLLDFEEARLPCDPDTRRVTDALRAILLEVLRRIAPADGDPTRRAQDVLAIIRGMVDAAGENGERDQAALRLRVERAVFGYVECLARPHPARP